MILIYMSKNINTIKKDTETLLYAVKEAGRRSEKRGDEVYVHAL
jgi:hypothetical protein